MTHNSVITTSRYHGCKVYEFIRSWGSYYKVAIDGLLINKDFYFLADAFNYIDDVRKSQVQIFTPINH